MLLAHGLDETAQFRPSVITIGKFDGVHAGHRHLIRQVLEEARRRDAVPTVLTFDRHPASVLAPDRAPLPLLSLEERCARIAGAGIEQLLVLPFTLEVARMTPEEFVASCLRDALRTRAVLVGSDFRFGHAQSGNPAVLGELGRSYGFDVVLIDAFQLRGHIVSTSAVRQRIEDGNVSLACRLLGQPYSVSGTVVRGQGIGSKQTVPTLNLEPPAVQLPRDGVFITRTFDLDAARQWKSITNVGIRPTFSGEARTIETFLLDPLEGPPPERIRVDLLRRVRDEKKFAGPEELKQQIFRDVGRAKTYFRRSGDF
jgi:riboflavin kinase/FMN adenylyltransferase